MSSYSTSPSSKSSLSNRSVFTDGDDESDDDNKIPSQGDLSMMHKHPELGSSFEYRKLLFFNTGLKDTLDLRRVHPIKLERKNIRFYYPLLAIRYLIPFVTFETPLKLSPLFQCHMPFKKGDLMELLEIPVSSSNTTLKQLETRTWVDGDTVFVELVTEDDLNMVRIADKLNMLDHGSKRRMERNVIIASTHFVPMESIAQAQNLLHSTKNNLMFFYLSK